MKRFKQNYPTLFLATLLVLSSCGGLNKMRDNASNVGYTVTPNPVELHANEVSLTINAKYPEKYVNKKAVVTVTPYLKYDGGEIEFEPTTFQGEKVKDNHKVIPFKGGDISYTGKVPYKEGMMRSDLMVKMSAQVGKKAALPIPGLKIADGIVTTPLLVDNNTLAIFSGDNYVRVTPEAYSAEILYPINRAEVRDAELRKEGVKTLEKDLKAAQAAERKAVKGAKVSAYASPDGDLEKINTPLSANRGISAQRYLDRVFKSAKLTEAQQKDFLSVMSTPEDWEGFKKLMEASDIRDKELVLRVLSMYTDPVVREREIKNISAAFKEIADKILPQLRRSVMTINVEVTGYSDEELADLAVSNPDSLKIEELLRGASLQSSDEAKIAAYTKVAANFPDDYRAKNSLGYIYLKQGKTDAANTEFQAAQEINDDNIVKNNLGAAFLAKGDLAKAEEYLTSAMGAGDEVNYNLGIIKIKQGDYKNAVSYFGSKPSFNAALAQLLNGENDKAHGTLNQLGEVDDSKVYYLKAVASARGGNQEGVFNNLRTAVGKDSKWKEYAQKDVEFLKYATNEAFTSIVR